MPITKKDLEEKPISFCRKDSLWVLVSPHSKSPCGEYKKIPLDGKTYISGGTITFKNGQSFRASFEIDTTTLDLVKKDTIYLNIGDDWYNIEEPELLTKLNLTINDIFPLTWQPDKPLDYPIKAPYTLKRFPPDKNVR